MCYAATKIQMCGSVVVAGLRIAFDVNAKFINILYVRVAYLIASFFVRYCYSCILNIILSCFD